MAYTAPLAPRTFLDGGLSGLKTALELADGATTGFLVLLSALPTDKDDCFSECGVAGDSVHAGTSSNIGSLVLGYASLGTITGPIDDTVFEDPGTDTETGRKLQFAAVSDVILWKINQEQRLRLL